MKKTAIEIIKELEDRKIINNITNKEKLLKCIEDKKALYVGFDPSFQSLHLGNYVMLHFLNYMSKCGIKTYALIGGATGSIGDPSGKTSERKLQDKKIIEKNSVALGVQIAGLTDCEIINNTEFYKKMSVFDFLRTAGKLVNVNYLLEKEIIKNRLETGISYAEFSYNLIQGYDFLYLYKNKNVAIQGGGSDQWGNITTGLEMIRKDVGDETTNAAGITINLLTKSDGTKFGKSESGAIYLDQKLTSQYEMYQFLINQKDEDLNQLFNFFSSKTLEKIKELISKHNDNRALRYGQAELAKELVTKIHGEEAYKQCIKISKALFSGEIEKLSKDEMSMAIKQFTVYEIKKNLELHEFILNNQILNSKRQINELIGAKALFINNILVEDINEIITKQKAFFGKYIFIRKGKKNYFVGEFKN